MNYSKNNHRLLCICYYPVRLKQKVRSIGRVTRSY